MDNLPIPYERARDATVEIKALPPAIFEGLGPVGRIIGEIISYRVEARRAAQQLRELRAQLEVASMVVTAQSKSQLAELEVRARAADGALLIASGELQQRAKTTDALIEALASVNEHMTSAIGQGNGSSDLQMWIAAKAEMVKLLADFTLASSQGTLAALDKVQAIACHPARDLVQAVTDTRRALG